MTNETNNIMEIKDTIEDIKVQFLGSDYSGPEVLGVNGVVEMIREYPNGTRQTMGLCYATKEDGTRPLIKEIIMAGPTHLPNDPRNITPEGVLTILEEVA
jgi:hypothetical protein